ncbi:MAG TPA: S41 family peptidase [Chitinophagaceae bacterium]|nr:S41 family peptidase [Chitinophagaceae bacterium]
MKKFIILLVTFYFSAALPAQVIDELNAPKTYSKEQLKADIEFLLQTIEHVHPNPFHAISREKMYKLKDSVLKSFSDGMSARQAWPGFARIVAALNEGHSNLNPPADDTQGLQNGKTIIFPVLIKEFDGDGLIVRYDLSDDSVMATGDRIISINGRSSKDLMNYFTSFYGGLTNWRNLQVIRDFAGNLLLHGINAPYRIEYIHNGEKKEITIKGTTFPQLRERAAAVRKQSGAAEVKANYSFERMENNTGYMNFRSMNDYEKFSKFLDSVFTDIKRNPVNGLIIDLRQNGGGSSQLGEKLLAYITDKAFLMSAGSVWKVSDEYKAFIKEQALTNKVYASGSFQNYLNFETGKMISFNSNKAYKPGNNGLRYSGKVCVLIGPNTFSSANMLANAIKDFKLAALIGEATGEPGNDYGELYWNKLPNTQLGFSTCTKQFIRANGDKNDPNPILPDIEVKQDRHSTKDNVLEFAKEWVLKK